MPPNDNPKGPFADLSTTQKEAFLNHLKNGTGADLKQYDLYFHQLQKTCEGLGQGERGAMSAKNWQDVLGCIEELLKIENVGRWKRSELRKAIHDRFYSHQVDIQHGQVSDEQINNTINFVLRIILTINVRSGEFAGVSPWITWTTEGADATSTLAEFVKAQFPKRLAIFDKEYIKDNEIVIGHNFSAALLWENRGVKIEFTYDMRHHLHYDSENRQLFIYPLRRWLELHKASNKSMIPNDVIIETLRTLALLFPVDQGKKNKKLLKKFKYKGNLKKGFDYPFDPPSVPLDSYPNITLGDFYIWHVRLAKIYSVFIGPPTSEYQKFREDFKGWFGFWGAVFAIVVMTFVFGVLATTFAILAWKDGDKAAEDLLVVVKELLEVVKSVTDARTAATVTVTAVRF